MRQLAESGELQALTPERSWKEISRALMEPNPEVFIQVLHDCGALAELIPEVEALFGVPQPAAHHPEIDTGVHVLSVLQQCARHRQRSAYAGPACCTTWARDSPAKRTGPAISPTRLAACR